MLKNETNRAIDALKSIPADLPHDEWVKIGMALHAAASMTTTNGVLKLHATKKKRVNRHGTALNQRGMADDL